MEPSVLLFATALATGPALTLDASRQLQPRVWSSSDPNQSNGSHWCNAGHSGQLVGFVLSGFRIQVSEDVLDDFGTLEGGDDPRCPNASRAGLDVNVQVSLQAPHPNHRRA